MFYIKKLVDYIFSPLILQEKIFKAYDPDCFSLNDSEKTDDTKKNTEKKLKQHMPCEKLDESIQTNPLTASNRIKKLIQLYGFQTKESKIKIKNGILIRCTFIDYIEYATNHSKSEEEKNKLDEIILKFNDDEMYKFLSNEFQYKKLFGHKHLNSANNVYTSIFSRKNLINKLILIKNGKLEIMAFFYRNYRDLKILDPLVPNQLLALGGVLNKLLLQDLGKLDINSDELNVFAKQISVLRNKMKDFFRDRGKSIPKITSDQEVETFIDSLPKITFYAENKIMNTLLCKIIIEAVPQIEEFNNKLISLFNTCKISFVKCLKSISIRYSPDANLYYELLPKFFPEYLKKLVLNESCNKLHQPNFFMNNESPKVNNQSNKTPTQKSIVVQKKS